MNQESSKDVYIPEKENPDGMSKDTLCLPFQSEESFRVFMKAFNKYERSVKRHIDPEINSDEVVLLLSNLIETLADSMPHYCQEPKTQISFLNKTRQFNKAIKNWVATFIL